MRGYSKLTYSGRPLDRVLWQNLSTHCYPALLTDAVKTGVPFDVVDIWVNWLSSTFPTDNYHNAGFEAILFGCLTQWTARWRPAQLAVWRSFSHCLLPSPPTPPPPFPSFCFSSTVQLLRGWISYFIIVITNHKRKNTAKQPPATQATTQLF